MRPRTLGSPHQSLVRTSGESDCRRKPVLKPHPMAKRNVVSVYAAQLQQLQQSFRGEAGVGCILHPNGRWVLVRRLVKEQRPGDEVCPAAGSRPPPVSVHLRFPPARPAVRRRIRLGVL